MGNQAAGGTVFASDAGVGSIAMTNPSNAGASDDSYATAVLTLAAVSNYLKASGFRFAIPTDAVVVGIVVEVERSSSLISATQDSSIRLMKAGLVGGSDKAAGGTWPTTDATATYGSAADLWGTTWTPAEINDANFGVVVAAQAALAGTAQIDFVRITVYYEGSNRMMSQSGCSRVNAGGMGQGDFI